MLRAGGSTLEQAAMLRAGGNTLEQAAMLRAGGNTLEQAGDEISIGDPGGVEEETFLKPGPWGSSVPKQYREKCQTYHAT
jgi:hypothetical protein